MLRPALCPTYRADKDNTSPLAHFARLAEASAMLDKTLTTINNPTSEDSFNREEAMVTIQATTTLQKILLAEIPIERQLYSAALGLCYV